MQQFVSYRVDKEKLCDNAENNAVVTTAVNKIGVIVMF